MQPVTIHIYRHIHVYFLGILLGYLQRDQVLICLMTITNVSEHIIYRALECSRIFLTENKELHSQESLSYFDLGKSIKNHTNLTYPWSREESCPELVLSWLHFMPPSTGGPECLVLLCEWEEFIPQSQNQGGSRPITTFAPGSQ